MILLNIYNLCRPEILGISSLKGLAQAEIIKKSVILFWLLNITIGCKHVHTLDLQFFLIFFCRAFTGWTRYRDEIPVFLIIDMVVNNYKSGISSLYLV